MPIIHKSEQTTLGSPVNLRDVTTKIYDPDEIKNYQLDEAINNHPLVKRPTAIRSKLAYKEIIHNTKPTKKYLLPGHVVLFHDAEPKFKEELEYYDRTPFTLFLGITRTKDGNIREVGLNLHFFPPFARARILTHTYNVFKPYFDKNFNDVTGKPNTFISYKQLKHLMRTNLKIAFGIKMYIPVLRQASWVIPSRLLSTAMHTEGRFSTASLQQIFHFWRQFK